MLNLSPVTCVMCLISWGASLYQLPICFNLSIYEHLGWRSFLGADPFLNISVHVLIKMYCAVSIPWGIWWMWCMKNNSRKNTADSNKSHCLLWASMSFTPDIIPVFCVPLYCFWHGKHFMSYPHSHFSQRLKNKFDS